MRRLALGGQPGGKPRGAPHRPVRPRGPSPRRRRGSPRCARSGRAPTEADRRAPARQAREAVRAVADERQPVGYRRRARPRSARGRPSSSVITPRAPVELDDALADDALGQVLVRRADEHLVDAGIVVRDGRGRGEGVVGLELGHRPHPHAEGLEGLLEQPELGLQLGRDLGAGLVAGPQVVAERLDDVIGRHARDASRPWTSSEATDQTHAPRRAHLGAVGGRARRAGRRTGGTARRCRRSGRPARRQPAMRDEHDAWRTLAKTVEQAAGDR